VDETPGDVDHDGYTRDDGDCDDDNGFVNPGMGEMCDGVDNNCDGDIDEGCDEAIGESALGLEDAPKEGCACATATPWRGLGLWITGLVGWAVGRRRDHV